MDVKSKVLDALDRKTLLDIADNADISLSQRRALAPIRDDLSSAKELSIHSILSRLKRNDLKAVCRKLELPDDGRAKADLIARIVDVEDPAETRSKTQNSKSDTNKKMSNLTLFDEADLPEATENKEKLSLQVLERHLWSSADILRGSIDAADFKNFIFGLLFVKRLNDVFEEEAERLETNVGYDHELAWEDPDEHRFFVPKRARWSELAKVTTDVGSVIDKAVSALEDANPELDGVFGGITFNDKDKLPDTLLVELIRHYSKLRLRNEDLEDPDILGRAYEYLIAQFASSAGKKGGEFYTPREVVQLLVKILSPEEGMRIYDPCCGSGGMLINAARYLKDQGKNPGKITLFGQERNVGTQAICRMNIFLHDLEGHIAKGNTLTAPMHLKDGALRVFDRVISNPPFSQKKWGRKQCENDSFNRFAFGIPPASYADLAFVQHMIASCNRTGMVGTVMPHGVLFRGGQEEKIRKKLIEKDLIEAVIGLAPNLFYGTGIPACLLILNKNKVDERRDKILFVYGANEFEEGKNQNSLNDEHVNKLADAFMSFEDADKFSRVVPVSEIEENDYNLNITRYVDVTEEEEPIDVAVELKKLRALEQERDEAEKTMYAYLTELGYE